MLAIQIHRRGPRSVVDQGDSPIIGKPTPEALQAAASRTVPDLIAPGLKVLFCGINPGLYSAAVGHHFARPGNRFWPSLQRAGFSERLLRPDQKWLLLQAGFGITNLVERASARADALSVEELVRGGERLEEKLRSHAPRWLAVLGVGAYRAAWGRRRAGVGRQADTLAGTRVWVLPNPSGLNAHYNLEALAREFGALRAAVDEL